MDAGIRGRQQAETDVEHKRRSIGLPIRHPMGIATASLPKSAQIRGASCGQPGDALQYLANKGARMKELETELAIAQGENTTLSQQVQEHTDTLQTKTTQLAILQGERDFLTSQRDQERQDMEQQLFQSEQRILTLTQSLRRSEQGKVL